MTRGQIFNAISDCIKDNDEYKKHFAELSKHYGYLKKHLPVEMRGILDRFYFCTVAIETVVMETAFMLGAEQLENARVVRQDAING